MPTLKQIRRGLRKPLEIATAVFLRLFIPLFPRRSIIRFSQWIGRMGWRIPSREKAYALKNLDAVFGDSKTVEEKKAIVISSFATFCLTMLDLFWFSSRPEKRIAQYVEFASESEKSRFLEEKPLICITAHFGNWEIMGQATALMGAPMASVAATIKNETVNKMLVDHRQRTGQVIIPQEGALRTLIARLRKKGKAAFVLDQHTDPRNGGIRVDFLGLPMSVSSAPAALAYRTGTDIMLGFCFPEASGRYAIHCPVTISPPPYDKAADTDAIVYDLTQQIENGVSAVIREHPHFWLWSYKHWRRSPDEIYPSHYPAY